MNTEIWNSSKMGGTGGALKALTKNLANQLTLNRTEMKRVVARVISERHGQGDVGDYNGHMFYVRPERVDLTEQITHSKEVFDEMINQKKLKQTRNQLPSSRSVSRSQSRAPPNSNSNNNSGGKQQRQKLRKKLKTERSVTGVVIDPQAEIGLQLAKPTLRPSKSKQHVKQPKAAASTAASTALPQVVVAASAGRSKHRHQKPAQTLSKRKSSNKLKLQARPETNPNPASIPRRAASAKRKLMVDKQPQRQQTKAGKVQRLNAGKVVKHRSLPHVAREAQPQPLPLRELATSRQQPAEAAAVPPKSILKRHTSLKRLPPAKGRIMKKKVWLEPWQDPRRFAQRRLRAGGVVCSMTKANRLQAWRHPYQFQGGAGATQRHNVDHGVMMSGRPKIKPRINCINNKLPPSRSFRRSAKAARLLNLRSHHRLVKQLEAEEAIDDPERMEAGTILDYGLQRTRSAHSRRGKRRFKLSPRMEQLARPVHHGHPNPVQASPSHLQVRKVKKGRTRRRRRRRVVVDSSLGSIAGLKGSSRSGLTPAKRHLTLAFMNKDAARSPRRSRTAMWR
ncbi:hypothetical protein KR044_000630 [Drosophila immigrans]|nr:hypothetical protein KR044_000630 [Drosophila immigrans]